MHNKKVFTALLLVLLVAISLCACAADDGVPKAAKDTYIAFCEACKTDPKEAAKYVNFTSEESRSATEEASPTLLEYEIRDWVKLSDELWAVQCWGKNISGKEMEIYSFVILIDGEYRVARNITEIPNDLRDTLDLTPYIPTDEDVMLPSFND